MNPISVLNIKGEKVGEYNLNEQVWGELLMQIMF